MRCGLCPGNGHLKCFHEISNISRGGFSPIWEMAAAAYGNRAPFSQQVRGLPSYTPEGTGGDHPGWGTLMFYDGPPAGAGGGRS